MSNLLLLSKQCQISRFKEMLAGDANTNLKELPVIMIVLEMGMISPPVGLNVFIIKSIAPEVPMREFFAGSWPFGSPWPSWLLCWLFSANCTLSAANDDWYVTA